MCLGWTQRIGLEQWPPFTRRSPSVLSNGIPLNRMTITRSNLQTLEKTKHNHCWLKTAWLEPAAKVRVTTCHVESLVKWYHTASLNTFKSSILKFYCEFIIPILVNQMKSDDDIYRGTNEQTSAFGCDKSYVCHLDICLTLQCGKHSIHHISDKFPPNYQHFKC